MKCPNCGCSDFYEDILRTGMGCTEGGSGVPITVYGQPVTAYLCKKCGRIELYGEESLKAIKKSEALIAKRENERIAAERRREALLKEKETLEAIVNDENQTVKVVKQATKRLEEIKKELGSKTFESGVHPVY